MGALQHWEDHTSLNKHCFSSPREFIWKYWKLSSDSVQTHRDLNLGESTVHPPAWKTPKHTSRNSPRPLFISPPLRWTVTNRMELEQLWRLICPSLRGRQQLSESSSLCPDSEPFSPPSSSCPTTTRLLPHSGFYSRCIPDFSPWNSPNSAEISDSFWLILFICCD